MYPHPTSLERLEEIVTLNTKIFTPLYEWPTFTFAEYKERLKDTAPYILIVENDENIIADSISFGRDGYWYIWILGVSPEYRNQGIASKLLEMNETYAKEVGYEKVRIKIYEVSQEMLSLTKGRGYEVVEKIESEHGSHMAFVVEHKLR